MKRLICLCVAVILLVAVPGVAGEKVGDGYWLKEMGDKGKKHPYNFHDGVFAGYTHGVLVATNAPFCPPEKWDKASSEPFEIVRKYLKDHPDDLHQPAYALVIKAIQKAWPCTK